MSSWNRGAQRFLGYEAAEILGRPFSSLYLEEDQASGVPAETLRTAGEGRFEGDEWRVTRDGDRLWCHIVVDPVWDPAGKFIGYAQSMRDLTERREVEAALKRSEQQFTLLVQGVTDYAIFMLDENGYVSSWNAGAQRIKGYRPEEIIGEHFSRFYTPEDRASGLPQRGLAVARAEGRFENEGWRIKRDGSRFWAHVIIDAIRDESGSVIGFAKVTRDVTERREAQKNLEKAQQALFQSQKLDAIGQLTGGVAHDFNNLLTAILGGLEIARKRIADERTLNLIDNAIRGAQRGAALTQRMLAFARRQDLKSEAVDVERLVLGMRSLIEHSIGPRIQIETRFPPNSLVVNADANQLEAALLNLVVNARDAMPQGGGIVIAGEQETVAAGHRTGLSPGDYVRLSVTDTGEGMDPQTAARAVEPFFTTKGVGKGTGLGLPMVHGLAEQSGGKLTLESSEGVGTTVELWLPAADRLLVDLDLSEVPALPEIDARPLRVLAVDDDGLVLQNTAAMLEDLGHTVLQARSGRDALDILRHGEEVDVVISDQAMPEMTGAQLVDAIRLEWPQIPVVLATGFAELAPGDTSAPRLAKPFFQSDLAQALAAACRRPVEDPVLPHDEDRDASAVAG